jgi:hypothetical protein
VVNQKVRLSEPSLAHCRIQAKGHPQYAERPSGIKKLFAMKRPLSPGVAILNKAACGLGLNSNVPLRKSLRVRSGSLLNVLHLLNTKVRECDRQDLAHLIVCRAGDTHASRLRNGL